MTYYHRCRNCAVDHTQCEIRQNIRTAISGLGITSIRFKCKNRKPMFSAGDRISFTWQHFDNSTRGHDGECEGDILTFKGTVAGENEVKGKFVVRVDQDKVCSAIDDAAGYLPEEVFRNGGFAVIVSPKDMRLTNEQKRNICPVCLGYDINERCVRGDYCNPIRAAMCRQDEPGDMPR